MKKIFALLLALVMALALVACGQKEDNIGGETKDGIGICAHAAQHPLPRGPGQARLRPS